MKKIIMFTICCFLSMRIISMEQEQQRININGDQGGRYHSTDIIALEKVESLTDLKKVIKRNPDWKSVIESYEIEPKALAEWLVLKEARHQVLDEKTLQEFEKYKRDYPQYYCLCIQDLLKELYQKDDKNILLPLQQEFRRNIASAIYDVQGQITIAKPYYTKVRMNYRKYIVQTCIFSTISLCGFVAMGYFGWVLHHCTEV